MEKILQDLKFAFRVLTKRPAFALITITALALGIGANAIVFGVVDAAVLNPFPFPDIDRLILVGNQFPKMNQDNLGFIESLSAPEYADIKNGVRSLEKVVAFDLGNRQIAGGDRPERVFTGFWWGDGFETVAMPPALGRGFSQEDIRSREPVAIISHRLWQSRFGGDESVVGSTIRINGSPYTLIGIMPKGLLVVGTDLWMPMWAKPEEMPRNRRQFQVMARLEKGSTLARANAELNTLARQVESQYAAEFKEYEGWRLGAARFADVNVRDFQTAGYILMGAVGFVLLLVCVNIANLQLSRAANRRREVAVRTALGAGRFRILGQMLTESLLLALAGGAAGVGLAYAGTPLLAANLPDITSRLGTRAVAVDERVLVFALLLSCVCGIVFGLAPAWQASRMNLQNVLNAETTRSSSTRATFGLHRIFVAVEVALALVLLVGAALMLNSFLRLTNVNPGFETDNLLAMRLTIPWERYRGDAITQFFETLADRVKALPGVSKSATVLQYPPQVFLSRQFSIVGREQVAEGQLPTVFLTIASHDFFDTLGVPLRAGRGFTNTDSAKSPSVAILNEAAADRYFPGVSAIGQRIRFQGIDREIEIIGIAASVHNRGQDTDPQPEAFISIRQAEGWSNQHYLLVRTVVPPYDVLPGVREVVTRMDPEQPIYAITTMDEAFASSNTARRIAVASLALFAALALVLASIGIYGVVSYSVAQRTREIGLRMALGAAGGEVRRLVIRQALIPVAAGAAIGLTGAFFLGQVLNSLLFKVDGRDPLTLAATAVLLALVGLLASYLPARRASGVDPAIALRYE